MTSKALILALACSGLLIVGCDRGADMASSGGSPTSQPSATIPTTNPGAATAQNAASTQPAYSTLIVDGTVQEWFPRAMLRVTRQDGQILARLYSDDPSGVLSGKETVNSYDLEMPLPDIDDPANIAKAIWTSKSVTMDKQDTPYGIFLNDQKKLLQPLDVTVRFATQAPYVIVMLQGTFRQYSMTGENSAPEIVQIMGALKAAVPDK